jgi:hypothetical protein
VNETAVKVVHLGELDVAAMRLKHLRARLASFMAISFSRRGRQDVEFVKTRYFGTIFPYLFFQVLILFLLFQVCIRITVVRSGVED